MLLLTLVAYNFVFLFLLDAFSAIFDLIVMLCNPKHMSRHKRLRLLKKKAMQVIKEKDSAKQEEDQHPSALLTVNEAKLAEPRSPKTPRKSKSS